MVKKKNKSLEEHLAKIRFANSDSVFINWFVIVCLSQIIFISKCSLLCWKIQEPFVQGVAQSI